MEGIRLEREENGSNKVGKKRGWEEQSWEEKRVGGISLEIEEIAMKKVGKRRE